MKGKSKNNLLFSLCCAMIIIRLHIDFKVAFHKNGLDEAWKRWEKKGHLK